MIALRRSVGGKGEEGEMRSNVHQLWPKHIVSFDAGNSPFYSIGASESQIPPYGSFILKARNSALLWCVYKPAVFILEPKLVPTSIVDVLYTLKKQEMIYILANLSNYLFLISFHYGRIRCHFYSLCTFPVY